MIRRLSVLAGLVVLAAASIAAAQQSPVRFLAPRDGAVVRQPIVTVTGQAEPQPQASTGTFDVMIVIDVSGSTRVPASAAGEMHASGPFGVFRGGGPTILEVEVAAAMKFVEAADSTSTRIGVATFSESGAYSSRAGSAWVEQPLTSDYRAVRGALERIGRTRPNGGTDMVAGVRLAIRELRALAGAASAPRPDARKVILFMTDGFPTLPFMNPAALDERNVNVTLDAARVAAKAGIVVHTFCLGREALSAPVVCREAAELTGGKYHPVQRPADVIDILPATRIGRVEIVTVRNATTGQMARKLTIDADGRFSADVPLVAGPNRVVVQMQSGGEGGTAVVVVNYEPEVKPEIEIKVEPGR